MAFANPFSRVFVPPLVAPAVSAAPPWYLLGGVTSAQCVAAYKPKGAASLAASYTNLAHPGTNDAAPGTAPTLVAAGWNFVGASSQYLTTGIVFASGTATFIVQYVNVSGVGRLYGMTDGVNLTAYIQPNSGGTRVQYNNGNGTATNFTPALASGNVCVARDQCYRNGSLDGALAFYLDFGANSTGMYIGAFNNSGVAANFFTGTMAALAVYNVQLNGTQVSLIAAAMAAL